MSDAAKSKELVRKLGIRKGFSLVVMNPPYGFVQQLVDVRERLRSMQTDIKMNEGLSLDMIIYFSRSRKGIEENFPRLMEDLAPDGAVWVGWLKPKTLKTDLNEKTVRAIAEKNGMTDVDRLDFSDDWPMIKFARAKVRR